MNGRTHVVIGAAAPLGAAATGATPGQCAVLAIIGAGFSLGPDIDHPNATATKILGRGTHRAVRRLSSAARLATSTTYDGRSTAYRVGKGRDPEHRGLTHTAVAAGVVAVAAGTLASIPMALGVLTGASVLACSRLFVSRARGLRAAGGLLILAAAAWFLAFLFPVSPYLAAFAAGAGWMSHLLADACTTDGVPLLWPMTIRGRRWYRVRLLGSLLASGSSREWWAAITLAGILALPATSFLT